MKKDIINITKNYSVGKNDRIVINGGEPTLHKELIEIIYLFKKTGAYVTLYSNGCAFCDKDYTNAVIKSGVDRITVPIHGTENIHNYITQNKRSYYQTIKGLENLSVLKEKNKTFRLELKNIITKEVLSNNFNLHQEMDSLGLAEAINTYILCGVVSTKVSNYNKYELPRHDLVSKYISDIVLNLISKKKFSIKIMDVMLCRCSRKLIRFIKNNFNKKLCVGYDEFYYFDEQCVNGILYRYDKKTNWIPECETCSMNLMCNSIQDKYRVLNINNGVCYTDME